MVVRLVVAIQKPLEVLTLIQQLARFAVVDVGLRDVFVMDGLGRCGPSIVANPSGMAGAAALLAVSPARAVERSRPRQGSAVGS